MCQSQDDPMEEKPMQYRSVLLPLALLLLFTSQPHADTCGLSLGAGCTFGGTIPNCCASGLMCKIASGSSGTCCITAGSGTACSTDSECCSGICEANKCAIYRGQYGPCSSALECDPAYPFCAKDSIEGRSRSCGSCIEDGSFTQCSSNLQCCSHKCDSLTSYCATCLDSGARCIDDSDCCSGLRCESFGEPAVKKCVAAFSCSMGGGYCGSSGQCCSSPPSTASGTLVCDTLNSPPSPPAGKAGACRDCVPDTYKCVDSSDCCSVGTGYYSCTTPAAGGSSNTYCLAEVDTGVRYLFANWVKSGSGNFVRTTAQVHSGSSAMSLKSSDTAAYMYNSKLVLKNSSKYLLEFWTYCVHTPGIRYAIYDVANDAYLGSSGEWSFSPRDGSGYDQPILFDAGRQQSYGRTQLPFTTLGRNVSHVQIRFYAQEDDKTCYLDDVSITGIHDFSILAWVKAGPNANGARLLYQMGSEAGQSQGLDWFFGSGNALSLGMYSAYGTGGATSLSPSATLASGDWHHLALVVNRTGAYSTYLDGSLVASSPFVLGRLNSTGNFYLGRNGTAGGAFKGQLDEVRLYQRALLPQEVYAHYRGKYQERLGLQMNFSYTGVDASKNLTAAYNAALRVRTLLPETVLSMPFDSSSPLSHPSRVTDHSRFVSHGTNYGASWTPGGKVGGAYSFNGSGAYIALPAGKFDFGTGDFSVSAWIYPTSNTAPGCGLMAVFTANETGLWNEGAIAFTINPSYGYAYGSYWGSLTNTWTHIVAVRKGGNLSIYENGVLKGSTASTGIQDYAVASGAPKIGYSYCGGATPSFSGKIDEFRVFSKALSQAEIGGLYRDSAKIYEGQVVASES